MPKRLLLTFDYELFLGHKSGTVQKCLIGPTNALLNLLEKYGLTGVFFIDTVYLSRLREMAAGNAAAGKDHDEIVGQLQTIVRNGHYIFPHIHAHWLDATYLPEENEWALKDTRYYQFSSLTPDRQKQLFDDSVATILSIAREVEPDYRVDSYRAGGWSIQPFQGFRPHFVKNQITHEWSVIPGKYLLSDAHTFDFRKAPVERPVYRFDSDVCIEEEKGPFTEWTISCLPMTRFERWLDFKTSGLLQRLKIRKPFGGSTVSSVIRDEGDIYENKHTMRLIATLEGLNPFRLRKYRAAIRASPYFQFISHPKLISVYDFKMMARLFRSLKEDVETDFRKALQ